MDLVSDHETTVVPHQLCSLCQEATALYTKIGPWNLHSSVDEESLDGQKPKSWPCMPHHASTDDLKASAASGCHLCTLFLRCMPDESAISATQEQLYIYPKVSTHQPMILLLHLSTADVFGDCTENSVWLYQSGYPRLPRLEFIGKNPPTLEQRFRWCTSTGARLGPQMIGKWLSQCLEDHEWCRKRLGELLPARLLDLNAFSDCEDLQLVLTSKVGKQAYATLSYRWGDHTTVTLRTENYTEFLSCIRYDSLPKTIQDAVEICRRLSIRYLWVDALCVIQENNEDFAHEVANMGSIYAGSLVTVAAGDSQHCNSGIYGTVRPLEEQDCIFEAEGSVFCLTTFSTCKCMAHDFGLQCSALNQRAWVYQERMMSPRTINFYNGTIIWECRTLSMCQRCAHNPGIPLITYPEIKAVFMHLHEYKEGEYPSIRIEYTWSLTVASCSKLQLSNEEDRLNVLAGVAQLMHRHGHETSYGHLLTDFFEQLMWFPVRHYEPAGHTLDKLDCIPSWSWLSDLRSEVNFASHTYENDREEVLYRGTVIRLPPATLVGSLSVITRKWPLRATRIKVRGLLQHFSHEKGVVIAGLPFPLDQNAASDTLDNCSCLVLKRTFDASLDSYYCSCAEAHKRTLSKGLVLQPLGTVTGIYRRVGYFERCTQEMQRLALDSSAQETEVEIE
ncbi:hypothetical protein OPT61_g7989 [Boeremia exigua]|uniref:Uncharacterized protein n=1 Tax=Boeremia exigua TaxID=749465 RepID=A0ACC2I0G4_9PLEO|nr:hypothetical protein OPT61_g7989 [Boeremia exigua]